MQQYLYGFCTWTKGVLGVIGIIFEMISLTGKQQQVSVWVKRDGYHDRYVAKSKYWIAAISDESLLEVQTSLGTKYGSPTRKQT